MLRKTKLKSQLNLKSMNYVQGFTNKNILSLFKGNMLKQKAKKGFKKIKLLKFLENKKDDPKFSLTAKENLHRKSSHMTSRQSERQNKSFLYGF